MSASTWCNWTCHPPGPLGGKRLPTLHVSEAASRHPCITTNKISYQLVQPGLALVRQPVFMGAFKLEFLYLKLCFRKCFQASRSNFSHCPDAKHDVDPGQGTGMGNRDACLSHRHVAVKAAYSSRDRSATMSFHKALSNFSSIPTK